MGVAKNTFLLAALGAGLLVSTRFSPSATLEEKQNDRFSAKFRSSVLLDTLKNTKSYNDLLKEIDAFWKAPKTISLYGTDTAGVSRPEPPEIVARADTTGTNKVPDRQETKTNAVIADTSGFKHDEGPILVTQDTAATNREKLESDLRNRQNEIKLQEKKIAEEKALFEKRKEEAERKARYEKEAREKDSIAAKYNAERNAVLDAYDYLTKNDWMLENADELVVGKFRLLAEFVEKNRKAYNVELYRDFYAVKELVKTREKYFADKKLILEEEKKRREGLEVIEPSPLRIDTSSAIVPIKVPDTAGVKAPEKKEADSTDKEQVEPAPLKKVEVPKNEKPPVKENNEPPPIKEEKSGKETIKW